MTKEAKPSPTTEPQKPFVQEILLASIKLDGGTQIRARLDDDTVEKYRNTLMDNGWVFPPVIVYQIEKSSSYLLSAGFHRIEAASRENWTQVPAEIRQGTYRDALFVAVESNGTHGLGYITNQDKRHAVLTLLGDEEWREFPNRKIARICGVSHVFVGQLRDELSGKGYQMPTKRVVERGGVVYTQETEKIGSTQVTGLQSVTNLQEEDEPVIPVTANREGAPTNLKRVIDTMSAFNEEQLRVLFKELERVFPFLFPKAPKLNKVSQPPPAGELGGWLKKHYSREELKRALAEIEPPAEQLPTLADEVKRKLRGKH